MNFDTRPSSLFEIRWWTVNTTSQNRLFLVSDFEWNICFWNRFRFSYCFQVVLDLRVQSRLYYWLLKSYCMSSTGFWVRCLESIFLWYCSNSIFYWFPNVWINVESNDVLWSRTDYVWKSKLVFGRWKWKHHTILISVHEDWFDFSLDLISISNFDDGWSIWESKVW